MDLDERRRRFLESAVWGPFKEACGAGGSRNAALNAAAFALGRWVAGGVVSRPEAEAACEAAAIELEYPDREARYHCRRALTQGEQDPRRWPEDIDPARAGGSQRKGWTPRPAAPALSRVEPAPPRPPAVEVAALWSTCIRLDTATEEPGPAFATTLAWLRSRGLNPAALADLDLVRVIGEGVNLPVWAAMGRRTWRDTWHLLVVQAWSAAGTVESLHARLVLPGQAEHKSVWPSAGPGSARGLVFANGPARLLLASQWAGEPPRALISEGVPDWLEWCSRRPDLPIFGMAAGGWTAEHAARVPDGATVIIREHHDGVNGAGEKYTAKIAETFRGRDMRLLRRRRGDDAEG